MQKKQRNKAAVTAAALRNTAATASASVSERKPGDREETTAASPDAIIVPGKWNSRTQLEQQVIDTLNYM